MPERDDQGQMVDDAERARRVHRMEMTLSHLLRAGVILSTAVVVLGMALIYLHHPNYLGGGVTAQQVAQEMTFPSNIAEVTVGIMRGEGRAVVILGLFILIATPVARVGASFFIFHHLRDRRFAFITLLVLALLLASFILGKAGG